MNYGLYVHIPYCNSKCNYCDFYSSPAFGVVPEEYIDEIIKQYHAYAVFDDDGELRCPKTVYFGGGTPSILKPNQIERMLNVFSPNKNAEITIEANPETASFEKLAAYRKIGVNRISFGVQSARDKSLRLLGRPHTAAIAQKAFENAQKAGFSNISGDIMMALANYSFEEFDETLNMLVSGGAKHISAYLLKIEKNTPFGKCPPANLPNEDEAAEVYLYAVSRLQSLGFARYEISNFAHEGYKSEHNLLYWNCDDWLGLGPSAHSSIGKKRFSFSPNTAAFLAGQSCPEKHDDITADDYIMLRLRLEDGLHEQQLAKRFGKGFSAKQKEFFVRLENAGLANWANSTLALTSKGMLVQNSILTGIGSVVFPENC